MPITPKPGHWYETRIGDIVAYVGRNPHSSAITRPHMVGFLSYTDDGCFVSLDSPEPEDLFKDLGTTDPRKPKKPRKAPAKKTRKVRMYFYRDSDASVQATQWQDAAERYHNAQYGRRFSRIIEVPVTKKAPHA